MCQEERVLAVREQIVFQTISVAHQSLDAARGDLELILARLQLMNAVSVYSDLLNPEIHSSVSLKL